MIVSYIAADASSHRDHGGATITVIVVCITVIVVCWTIAIDQGVAMSPSHSHKQTQDAMQQVYVSDKGDDKNDGHSLEAPIKSLKRLCVLWSGRELVLMEGRETFNKLVDEMVVFVRFAKGASKNESRASAAPKPDTSSP